MTLRILSATSRRRSSRQKSAEQVERLLGQLDAELRTVAMMKLEGFTNVEIADHFGVVERSIARKLARIRLEWGDELGVADQD